MTAGDHRPGSRIAIVGMGYVADSYMPSLLRFPGLEIVGAWDIDPSEEAAQVIAVSQRKRLLYMEAVATPFPPAVAAALQAAQSGRLGAPAHGEASFGDPVARADHPRLFEVDGGVLADRAVEVVRRIEKARRA